MSNIYHYSYRQDMRFRNASVSLWPLDFTDVLLNWRDLLFFIISVCVRVEIFLTFFFFVSVNIAFGKSQHLILHWFCSTRNPPPILSVPLAYSVFSRRHYLLLYYIFIMYLLMFIVYVMFMCIVWLLLLERRIYMGRDILFCSLKLSYETTVVFSI